MDKDFWDSFTPLKKAEPRIEKEKWFKVYLYKCSDCIRGWLSYVRPSGLRFTLSVEVMAMTSQKAKNKAITLINAKEYDKVKIVTVNNDDSLWGLDNFPELQREIKQALQEQKNIMDEIHLIKIAQCGSDSDSLKAIKKLQEDFDPTYRFCLDCDGAVVKDGECCLDSGLPPDESQQDPITF